MKEISSITAVTPSAEAISGHPHTAVDNALGVVCLLTTKDVARRLNVSQRTVNRLVENGELSPIDIRGCVRHHPRDIDDLIERRRRPDRRPTRDQPVRKPTRTPQTATRSFRERRRESGR